MVNDKCNCLTCQYSCIKEGCFIPQRWLGTILSLGIIMFAFIMRTSTHLAIVRMVVKSNSSKKTKNSGCREQEGWTKKSTTYGTNDWNEDSQSWILSCFYITYILGHIPAGYLSDTFGTRWVLSTGHVISAVCMFFYPIGVDGGGLGAMIVLRLIQGGAQGVVFPAVSAYLARWIPKHERATTGAISFSGTSLGPVVGHLITGFVMEATDNWRTIYYLWGIVTMIFYVFLVLYLFSEPTTHPFLTEREVIYLKHYLVPKQKKKIPYLKIFTDGPIIATVIGQCAHAMMIFTISNNMPKYLDNVLRFSVAGNGLFSALPYLGMLASSLISGKIADWGIKRKKWDVGFTRKVYTLFSNIVPTAVLVVIGYVGCRQYLAVALFALAMIFKGPFFAGLKVNTMDLTSQYSGIGMALANGVGSIIGFASPKLIAKIAPDNTFGQWQLVFWVIFVVSTLLSIIYLFMGSGKRRRWDYPDTDQQYFTVKLKLCSIFDGIDYDREAVENGRAAALSARGNPPPANTLPSLLT